MLAGGGSGMEAQLLLGIMLDSIMMLLLLLSISSVPGGRGGEGE